MASAFPARRIRRFATGLLLLILVAAPVVGAGSPGSDSGSAPSPGRVAPVVTSFAAALAFEADHPAPPPPQEEPPGWWLRLSAEDRALIAPVEYEDPLAILAAKKWHARFAQQAREAVAAGRTPPAPPKPIDSPSGHAITPAAGAIPEPAAGESASPDEQRGAGAAPAGEANGPSSTAALAAPAPSPQRAPVQPDAPGWYSSFAGMSTGWRPSDSTVAVGPAHVGAVVNSSLAFYTKDGTATVGPVSLGSWFSGAPIPGDLFDPKIVYDRWTGHWVVLALNGRDGDPENYYAVSVSQTNDPEGGWWTWYLRSDIDGGTDTTAWTDYPGLGYDSGDATNGPTGGAIYITSNQYGSGGGGFLRGKARVIPKYQIETGSSVGWWDFWNASVFAWKPASTDSSTGASPIEYLANTQSAGGSSLTLWTLTNPLGAGPSLGSTTVGSSVYGVPPNAEQLGGSSSSHLDTGDCRTQDVQFRNGFVFLTAGDYSFWSDVFDTDAVVHYWKINASSGAAAWDGYFGSNDEYFFFGKIAVDPSSNAHVVFSHSSPSTYARIGVTGILAADGLVQSYSIVGTGTATYDVPADSLERWGTTTGSASTAPATRPDRGR